MASTTTKGFRYPQSSDVADVPTDIQNLATDVDTKTGMFLVASGTVSITGGTTFNVNNCFTSTYRSYKIIYQQTSGSVASTATMRLRVGGVDNSASTYQYNTMYISTAAAIVVARSGGTTSFALPFNVPIGAGTFRTFTAEIHNPQSTQPTDVSAIGSMNVVSDASGQMTGCHTSSTSFDGFSFIYGTSGTFTGNYRVYGYNF